jgi:hypothetical protein
MREILGRWDRTARKDSNYAVVPALLENDWIAAVSSDLEIICVGNVKLSTPQLLQG